MEFVNMALKIDGFKAVKATRPVTASTMPKEQVRRKKFKDAVEKQLHVLDGSYKLTEGKRLRPWYWQNGQGWLSDVRYGNRSLLADGQAYQFSTKEELASFYNSLMQQCGQGAFDKEFEETANAMKESTGDALVKARAARGKIG